MSAASKPKGGWLLPTLSCNCASLTARQQNLLSELGLPVRLPDGAELAPEAIIASMRLDKKALGGRPKFVLPTRLGEVELVDVSEADVRAVLEARR